MARYQWAAIVKWRTGKPETHHFPDEESLKLWLHREAFCLKHGCPLPDKVTIINESRARARTTETIVAIGRALRIGSS